MGRKREHIAAAADRLFYREGFAQVGIDRIVEQAGVALGTLYKEFPGREALVVAAMDHRDDAFFKALAASSAGLEGAARVLGLFDALHCWASSEGGNGCFFLRAASAHPEAPSVRARALLHKRAYLKLIGQRLREGGWAVAEARRLAPAIFLLLEGAVAAAATLGDRAAIREAKKCAVILLETSPPGNTRPAA